MAVVSLCWDEQCGGELSAGIWVPLMALSAFGSQHHGTEPQTGPGESWLLFIWA